MAKHRDTANSFFRVQKKKKYMHILDIIPGSGGSGVQSPSEEREGDINKAKLPTFFVQRGYSRRFVLGQSG